jgi:D-lactate dehydrogenase (cytochrome)
MESIEPDFIDYLRDESRLSGKADSISFPDSENKIRALLPELNQKKIPVTVQGARTGVAGGAVPMGGHVINLSRMNRITGMQKSGDTYSLIVQPGVVLSQLCTAVEDKSFETGGWDEESKQALRDFSEAGEFFFSPDPTERTASIGGMAAADSSGARSYRYGPTRNHVSGLRVILMDGSVIVLERGRAAAAGRNFTLTSDDGRPFTGRLPSYTPPAVKDVAGYTARDDMDLIDLFIGSEGTLGIITEITITLLPYPPVIWSVVAFLPGESDAIGFVSSMREAPVAAMEYFDKNTLEFLRRQKSRGGSFANLPETPASAGAAVYLEFHGKTEDEVEEQVVAMSEVLTEYGGDEETTWFASNEAEMQRLKDFRHALPEAVNLYIDERRKESPDITKLSTDMSVPHRHLAQVMELYNTDLDAAGLEYVKFGHIGDSHIHVNILPKSPEEYLKGERLYIKWAEAVTALGGSVSAEHGIGKMKKKLLELMYSRESLEEMAELKRLFDPGLLLCQGNIFPV